MVQAYTLSDRIVQQGFNDAQFLVGRVYKNDGTIAVSSSQELLDSGAQSVSDYAQVCRYFYKSSSEKPTTCLKNLYKGEVDISSLLFDGWSDAARSTGFSSAASRSTLLSRVPHHRWALRTITSSLCLTHFSHH